MDSAGRLVIPKKIREEAGLKPGAVLDVSCRDGQIEIQPATMRVGFMRRGRFVIALPKKRHREAFTAETVEKALNAVREERAGRI
ncbi:MAG: AbrB/MazE/SpoVT family DNA-binding domain-containing protein [Terriglobia bacterium]